MSQSRSILMTYCLVLPVLSHKSGSSMNLSSSTDRGTDFCIAEYGSSNSLTRFVPYVRACSFFLNVFDSLCIITDLFLTMTSTVKRLSPLFSVRFLMLNDAICPTPSMRTICALIGAFGGNSSKFLYMYTVSRFRVTRYET